MQLWALSNIYIPIVGLPEDQRLEIYCIPPPMIDVLVVGKFGLLYTTAKRDSALSEK